MKKWLLYILKKIVEDIIVNGVKYLVGILLISSASLTFSEFIRNVFTEKTSVEHWMFILPYFVIFLAVIYFILRIPMIPRLSWDYIFGLNQHTICYIDKNTLEFTKTLSIIPLSKCVHQVSYDYNWTGTEINSVSLKKIDGDVIVDRTSTGRILNKGTLRINFNENPKVLRKYECDVTYMLCDDKKKMQQKLIITVKRPTLKSLLRVVTNPDVRIKNVKASVYSMFGDKADSMKIVPVYSMKYGNHLNAQTYYEWKIKHPKLFSRYEITWDIV